MVRSFQVVGLSAMVALSLTVSSCAGGAGSESDNGPAEEGVPVDASMDQYREALTDMDPVELTFQVSSSSETSVSGQRDAAFAEAIEEWSGGKIQVEVAYAQSIVSPDEEADALADGRLDLAAWSSSYHTDEMPALIDLQNALLSVPSSPLQGEILTHFVAQDVAFNTPEIMDEFDRQGMTVLNPYNPFGTAILACNEEKNSLGDFSGDQIRANAAAQTLQADALGASTASLELAETYEGIQRNLIQCSFGAPTSMTANGWLEPAGHVYVPEESSFITGPGSIVAGSSWDTLPLAAQQLIYDRMDVYNLGELGQAYAALQDTIEESNEHGSGMHYLDPELSAAVAEGNEQILETVRNSSNLDGDQLIDDVNASVDKWTEIAEELDYIDQGDFLDFPDWYEGSGEVIDGEYLDPIIDRLYDEVLMEHRPE